MDYYCRTKFTNLQVNVQGRLLYNCCRAYPEKIDLDWLEDNPGRLFHTDTMLADRKLMLENKSCHSCHHGCYKYEEQGLPSYRQQWPHDPRITDPQADLRSLDIVLSTDCNLKCVYCSPDFSSSWQREIAEHGPYMLDGQVIKNEPRHNLWAKMKQKDRSAGSRFFQLLLSELALAKGLEKISFLGGEPLLNNQLEQIIERVEDKNISITSGLGISHKRLSTVLKKIKGKDVTFCLSAEATGEFFEFIRYGVSWQDFKQRVEMIEDHGHRIKFTATMSNISSQDFHRFLDHFGDRQIETSVLSGRQFLMPHVMDEVSKQKCLDNLNGVGKKYKNVLEMIETDPHEIDRKNLGTYLKQLSLRRGAPLDFLPDHFLKWCGAN